MVSSRAQVLAAMLALAATARSEVEVLAIRTSRHDGPTPMYPKKVAPYGKKARRHMSHDQKMAAKAGMRRIK